MVNENNDQTFSPFSNPQVDLGVYASPDNLTNVDTSLEKDYFGVATNPEITEQEATAFVSSFENIKEDVSPTSSDFSIPSAESFSTYEKPIHVEEPTSAYEEPNNRSFDDTIEELERQERDLEKRINELELNLDNIIRGNDKLLKSIEEQKNMIDALGNKAKQIVVDKKSKQVEAKKGRLIQIEQQTAEAIKTQTDLSNELYKNEQTLTRLEDYIKKEQGLDEDHGRSIVYEQNAA